MRSFDETINRRIMQAGVLLQVGLFCVLFTLFWTHALSFIIFCLVGGLFCGLGILMYILWLVS